MKDYREIQPVLQLESMSCWAAAMEWWLTYMSGGPRPYMSQDEIAAIESIDKHIDYNVNSPTYGGLSEAGMKALCQRFLFDYQIYPFLDLDTIKRRLNGSGAPLLIVFNDTNAGGFHANVIVKRFKVLGTARGVVAMEPRNPSYEHRFIEYYNRGQIMLAWDKYYG